MDDNRLAKLAKWETNHTCPRYLPNLPPKTLVGKLYINIAGEQIRWIK